MEKTATEKFHVAMHAPVTPLDKGKMVVNPLMHPSAINYEMASSQRFFVDHVEEPNTAFYSSFGNTNYEEEYETEEEEQDFVDQELIRDDIYLEQRK